jgi:hypothetical protein
MEKRNKIIYWIATSLLALGMFASGLQQVLHTQTIMDLMIPLGYPSYFFYIIGTWKILAVIAILLPGFKLLKEWAYAGLFFVMTGALLSHLFIGDFAAKSIMGPVFQTVFIILSWYFRPADRKIVSN